MDEFMFWLASAFITLMGLLFMLAIILAPLALVGWVIWLVAR